MPEKNNFKNAVLTVGFFASERSASQHFVKCAKRREEGVAYSDN